MGFQKPTKVEAPLGTDANVYEAKIYWTNSYASVIGMMWYLASNTRPYIYFYVNQCYRFTHNTKASHETDMKRICRYIQGTKDNGLVFNTHKKIVMECYADTYFAGLWGHENPQYPIYDRSRTGFVVTFSNFLLLWVSKLQTEIAISALYSDYLELYHSIRTLLPLKSIIKEVIEKLGIYSYKLKFVSRSTVYEDNNGAIVVTKIPRTTPTSNKIDVKYHCFRQHVGKEFVIQDIESENQKADIFTKCLQGEIFLSIRKLLCGW